MYGLVQTIGKIYVGNPDDGTQLRTLILVGICRAKTAEKENEDKTDGKKGGKKTKVPNARDILPGNVALNDKIAAFRERWKCPTQGRQCGSEHCFVRPDEPEHYPLSHAQGESWGAAMLKGDEFATINKPPNNELFDKLDPRALAARSPLLQRRLELNQQKAAAAAPQININFPPELVGLFGKPAAPPPEPAVAAVIRGYPFSFAQFTLQANQNMFFQDAASAFEVFFSAAEICSNVIGFGTPLGHPRYVASAPDVWVSATPPVPQPW
ncbi:hypothetical protein B0H13DRAFT_1892379 [Mycena leptocephala]|nr:hypothetical protein B0H13DRAFT_1892379 [Mycena leptocephala]